MATIVGYPQGGHVRVPCPQPDTPTSFQGHRVRSSPNGTHLSSRKGRRADFGCLVGWLKHEETRLNCPTSILYSATIPWKAHTLNFQFSVAISLLRPPSNNIVANVENVWFLHILKTTNLQVIPKPPLFSSFNLYQGLFFQSIRKKLPWIMGSVPCLGHRHAMAPILCPCQRYPKCLWAL